MSKISFIKGFEYFLGVNLLQNIPFFFFFSVPLPPSWLQSLDYIWEPTLKGKLEALVRAPFTPGTWQNAFTVFLLLTIRIQVKGFPCGSVVKNLPASVGDVG